MSFHGLCLFASSFAGFVVLLAFTGLWFGDAEFREAITAFFLSGAGWIKVR